MIRFSSRLVANLLLLFAGAWGAEAETALRAPVPDRPCPYPEGRFAPHVEAACIATTKGVVRREAHKLIVASPDGDPKKTSVFGEPAACQVRYAGYDDRLAAHVIARAPGCGSDGPSLAFVSVTGWQFALDPREPLPVLEGFAAILLEGEFLGRTKFEIVPAPGLPGVRISKVFRALQPSRDAALVYSGWTDRGPRFLRLTGDPENPLIETVLEESPDGRSTAVPAWPEEPSRGPTVPELPASAIPESRCPPDAFRYPLPLDETACIAARPGISKRGDRHAVKLRNGKSVVLRSRPEACRQHRVSECRVYGFLGADDRIDAFVFNVGYYESGDYLLVDRETGGMTTLEGQPHVSPDRRRIAYVQTGDGPVSRTAVEILRREGRRWVREFIDPPPGQFPRHEDRLTYHEFEAWESPTRIRIRSAGETPTIAYLDMTEGRWEFVRPFFAPVINEPP